MVEAILAAEHHYPLLEAIIVTRTRRILMSILIRLKEGACTRGSALYAQGHRGMSTSKGDVLPAWMEIHRAVQTTFEIGRVTCETSMISWETQSDDGLGVY